MQRVSPMMVWFGIGGRFFFSFFSLVPKKLQLDPFGFWYFNFSPYSFNV
jgi:hypothetical protein